MAETVVPTLSYARWLGRVVALGLLAGACGFTYWLGSASNALTAANRGLVLSESDLDFGEVWEAKQFHRELTIENQAGEDRAIAGFAMSCSCLSVKPDSLVVPAGKAARIRLTLDLTSRQLEERDAVDRPFRVQLVPQIEGGLPRAMGWTIHGRVRNVLAPSQVTVRFGDTLIRGSPFSPRTLTLRAQMPLKEVRVEGQPKGVSIRVEQVQSGAPIYRLTIQPQANLSAGPFSESLDLVGVTPQGRTVWGATLQVDGKVLEDIQAIPPSLSLGARKVGETVQSEVFLRSASGKAFTMEGIVVESADQNVEPAAGAPVRGRVFRLTQRITRLGAQSAQLKFFVVTETKERVTVPVDIGYYGCNTFSGADQAP